MLIQLTDKTGKELLLNPKHIRVVISITDELEKPAASQLQMKFGQTFYVVETVKEIWRRASVVFWT